MKRLFIGLAVLVAAVIALPFLLLLASPVDSEAWQAPRPRPMDGMLTPNDRLKDAELLGLGKITGPEDVDVDAEGRVYGGLADGRIVRIHEDGSLENFANTGGRPLGMEFDATGNLIVADAWKGLLSIAPDGRITVLATEANGVPFGFTDDVDIAKDGVIYFSDASSKWHQPDYELDLLESKPYGRLLAYNPENHQLRVLLDGLHFANGVALSSNEEFVVVNETWRYRIARYWLKGPRAGQHDLFASNLPGFPDGISNNRDGTFWVALPSPRKADLDQLHNYPWLKEIVAALPKALRPQAERYGLVLALDERGQVKASLHDRDGDHLREITSVEQAGDYLYFGSLSNDRIGRLPVDEALPR